MTGSASLESLEFLFQKKSSISNQISPHAPFAVASAVNGEEAFQSQLAPDQKPKKRKILLDYNSCFRLWNPIEMALEIAKLKQEGFEVAFILKGKKEGEIFESLIEDKAEGNKKYDYKFKDKEGNDKSIFELSDDYIKKNFSKLDHEASIEKLNLTRDASIILSYEQFDEVDKIFKQEYWDDKQRVSVRSSLSYSFFKGAVNEYPSYKSVVGSFTSDDDAAAIAKKLENLLTHEDFNIDDPDTLNALNKLSRLTKTYDSGLMLTSEFKDLISLIKNEKTLEALFDKIPSLDFDKEQKILMQKNILKKLWFKCSQFEDVDRRAKTLDEFQDKSPDEIAFSLFSGAKDLEFAEYFKSEPVFSFDILERYQGGNALSIFKAQREYNPCLRDSLIIYIIAQQQINQTSFGKKIKVNITLSSNPTDYDFIKFNLNLSSASHDLSLKLSSFISIFSNPQINQQFNLTEQFGDAIISSLESHTLSEICDLCNYDEFVRQLGDLQKTRFLNLLQTKINQAENGTIALPIPLQDFIVLPIPLQHFLDQPEISNFVKSKLKEREYPDFSRRYLTPAFQDLLLELHEEDKLEDKLEDKFDLNKNKLPKESKLFARFDGKKQLELLSYPDNKITSLNTYLKNRKYCKEKFFLFDDTKISSQSSAESPLQITLFDLTEESLKIIKGKITSGELDPSKILSVDVLGIERDQDQDQKSDDEKIKSLTDFLKLFPNLKLAKIDIKAIESENKLQNSLEEFSNTIVCIHNSSNESAERILNGNSSQTIISPPLPFTATNPGDKIFMGDARSSGASKQDLPTTNSMEETGKIIQRPASTIALKIRNASQKLNLDFARLQDDLFVDIDESQAISSEEEDPIENSIEKFSQKDFEAKKIETASSDSSEKTICSFSRNLQANAKNILPSISPDNKIIGYYTEPPSVDVQFFKDESGFYYAKPATECQIHYLIEGQELGLQTPTQDLKDLPQKVKEIIKEYVGENTNNFPFSVKHDQYKLPAFSTKKQFLEDLFKLENKGSCRHRVASVAHKFENNGLECGIDFRIIGVNGNHVLMEVKKQNSDEWVTLDLGGSDANMVELSQNQNFQEDSREGKNDYPSSSPYNIQEGLTSILGENFTKLVKEEINYDAFIKAESNRLDEFFYALAEFANNCFSSSHNNPTNSPSCTSTLTVESILVELRQLQEIKDLKSFSKSLEKFVKEGDSSSLYLKTTRGEELKNYLLRMSSSSQNPPNPDSTHSALTSSSLSFQAFYASSPQDLTVKKSTLHIVNDDEISDTETKTVNITASTPLLSFLENAEKNKDKQHVLIIDWGNFDASSQVAFNTMFDKNSRKIDNQVIPDNVKIICIDSSKQQTTDSSILSRFGETLDLSSIPKNQFIKSPSEPSSGVREIPCDGEGLVNWKEKLFARIIVDGDAIKWEESDFVKSLKAFTQDETVSSNPDQPEQKDLHINFKNFSLTQQQEMKIFFEQAKATGSIDYHDYKITIPQDLSINFAQKEFEFTEVLKSFKPAGSADSSPSSSPNSKQLQLTIYQNSLGSNRLPQDIHLINSFLFDQLLTQPQIDGNQYREELGLIAKAKESSSPLKLFLSENLTPQQFYCLLNQAQEHQVALELYVAKDVKIPDTNLQKFTQEFELDKVTELTGGADSAGGVGFSAIRTSRESSPSPESPRIIITNNIEESLNKTIKAIESSNIQSSRARTINLVNVEDILYGDLFGKNQHKIVTKEDGSQHFAFEKIETALKAKLEAGETVILKGEFSAELLSLLHPQILDLQEKFSNLHFIIEDKNVSKSKPQSSKLSWLDPSLYKVEYSPELAKKTMEKKIVREDYSEIESSITNKSRIEADDFIKNRKDKLLKLLQENPILQIFGHSGVGKSSLLREIAKTSSDQPSDVAVYNELSSLEAWAQDKSEGKTKILVIDEFNVDGSTHFTLFRDLAKNPNKFPQTIFHDGKSVTLTEKHKVVFLGNPPIYGNRFKQKLFEDCQIPEWHLQDFPVSYIYEEILAKPIYAGLSEKSKEKLSEADFKEIAIAEIKNYKAKNQGDPQTKDILPSETVRELQEKVLKEIVKKISPIDASQVQNANFIATEANQESIAELQSAIEIRKLQKSGELPSQYLGTCGVIFEGDSGVGKSVMIEAVLENRGITRIDNLEALAQQIEIEKSSEISPAIKPHHYYKIPASLPIEEIEKNLIKAFELGVIVVFDEMNARIEEGGLEKTINQLLTGQHPKNSKIKSQPGFMLIASVNKATNAGRSALSPAIIHRSTVIKAKSLKEYTQEDFEKIIGNWVKNEGKQKGEISFTEKPNQTEIKEASEAIKKLVETQPEKLKNLRELQKIIPKVLSALKVQNNELSRAPSVL